MGFLIFRKKGSFFLPGVMWATATSRNVGGHIGIVQGFDTCNNGESNVQDMETWDMQGCMDNDSKIIVLHPLFGCTFRRTSK